MSDAFDIIINELSQIVELPLNSAEDKCALLIDHKLNIQLEYNAEKDQLMIGSFLGEAPPGAYRKELFMAALKANSFFPPVGYFAFEEQKNALFYYDLLPIANLTGPKLYNYLGKFVDKALEWQEMAQNHLLPESGPDSQKPPPSRFHIKP